MILDAKITEKDGRKSKYINKLDITREIAMRTKLRKGDIKTVLDHLEEVIVEELCDVDEENDVTIKPFDGLMITGKFQKEYDKINNLTGKAITVPAKVKVKATATKFFSSVANDNGNEAFAKFFNQEI